MEAKYVRKHGFQDNNTEKFYCEGVTENESSWEE
jgi:hypothetical protein